MTADRDRDELVCDAFGGEFLPHLAAAEPRAFDPFCSALNVSREHPPTLLIPGTKDTDVPYVIAFHADR